MNFYQYEFNNIKVVSTIDYNNDEEQQGNMLKYLNEILKDGQQIGNVFCEIWIRYFIDRSTTDIEFNYFGEDFEKEFLKIYINNIDYSQSMNHIWCFYITLYWKLTGILMFCDDSGYSKLCYEYNNVETEDDCCICFEKTNSKTKCNHSVCNDCISTLIMNNPYSTKCPLCRSDFEIVKDSYLINKIAVLNELNTLVSFIPLNYLIHKLGFQDNNFFSPDFIFIIKIKPSPPVNKIKCECGSTVLKTGLKRHQKTIKHKQYENNRL